MDEVEHITVSLPLTDELRDAVDAGEFASPGAAVEAAVEAWTADRMIERIGAERLGRHLQDCVESGDPQPLDVDEVLRRAKLRADGMRLARRSA